MSLRQYGSVSGLKTVKGVNLYEGRNFIDLLEKFPVKTAFGLLDAAIAHI